MSAARPHIFTLTGNLLAERTLEFSAWQPGQTQRAARETFQVGGKGINVSKMLRRLGAPNTALLFAGGATGDECSRWLRERGLAFRAFATGGATRAGTVVRDRAGAYRETTFLGPDVAPDAAALRACAGFLAAHATEMETGAGNADVLALCGSFPGWSGTEFDPLRAAIDGWLARGIVVADTYGPPLDWLRARPLQLIKLNAQELRAGGIGPGDPLPGPVQRWVVTDGPGALRICDRTSRDEREHTLQPPAVAEVSATGSGDVLLACVLEALFRRGATLLEAVGFALPYAAANAAHAGIAEFPEPL